MMNKIFVSIIFSISAFMSYGQETYADNNTVIRDLEKIPKERVYLSLTESALFSGETIKYKLYCFNTANKRLSTLSKVGYVSLISKEGSLVFNHKIKLDSGWGNGDFFIPTSIPTGSYKLFGYTEWMKNEGKETFFQSDIFIINPYLPLPQNFVETEKDSFQIANVISDVKAIDQNNYANTELFKLTLDGVSKGKRERVELEISTPDPTFELGSYSIAVRKIENFPSPSKTSAVQFKSELLKNKVAGNSLIPSRLFLPELRGELISGTVLQKDSGQPVQNVKVSFSLPGQNFLFKIATSDIRGRFHFNLDQQYDNDSGILQIIEDDLDRFEINLDDKQSDFGAVVFKEFKLSKADEKYILERSIENQIENAYQEVRADSIIFSNEVVPFYRNLATNYNLDDYTRFSTIPETIIEVVDQVSIRKLSDGNQVFDIRPKDGPNNIAFLPMVFIDGLFIQNHQDIIDFTAKKIKSISFSQDPYLVGTQKFQGVLSFKTFDGNFYDGVSNPQHQSIDLFKPLPQKVYFNQDYKGDFQESRIPDFRHELLWIPNISFFELTKKIVFYTSDVTGDFEVILEGFSAQGNPVYIKKTFNVR